MKAIILARVSTDEQMQEGYSIPSQLQRAREYCQKKKLEIFEEYPFDESSTKDHRKKFEIIVNLINEMKEPVSLVVETIDRLQRSFKESILLLDLIKSGKLEVHFIRENLIMHKNSNSSEFIRWDMGVMFARGYVLQLSDNVKRSFERKRRDGEYCGKPPLGYLNVKDENEKKKIVLDLERSHLIKKLFEIYSTGNYSVTSIYEKAIEIGLTNLEGKAISRSHIDNLLKETFYYGMAYSKTHGYYPHKYERIIGRELFDRCQTIREGRSNRPSKIISKDYIFKGLLKCHRCGCSMSPELHKGNVYYSCTNSKGICKRVYNNEIDLLKPIYKVFEAFEGIPEAVQQGLVTELRKINEGEKEFYQQEINRIRAEADKTQKRLDALLDAYLDQSITKDMYDKKHEQLRDKQQDLNMQLEEQANADHSYHIQVTTVLNLSRRIREIFESSETHEKRAILNYILQNPTVDGKKLVFTMAKPFNLVLELANCPTWLPR